MINGKTKKFEMDGKKYISLGLKEVWATQWWVILIAAAVVILGLILNEYLLWFLSLGIVGYGLYWLFWYVQFFGVTKVEQTQVFFQKLIFVFDHKYFLMQVPGRRQGGKVETMPVQWEMFKKVRKTKNELILFLSRGQFIYLPYEIFQSQADLKFSEALLKRKNLLK